MTPLKVAFYMHDLSGGGVERMRLTLIEELRSRGASVSLVIAAKCGPLVSLLSPDLPLVELGASRMLGAVRPLAAYLKRERPDVLISSLGHNNITSMLARLAARTSTKVIICQHNALSAERSLGWRYRAVPWLYWVLQRSAHGIIAVSDGVADDLSRLAAIPRSKITRIYNPVVDRNFLARAEQQVQHPWLEHHEDCPVFLFVGRLTEQKDPATLLLAFALLLQRSPARLIVLGEGALLPSLNALAAELGIKHCVQFQGFHSNPLPWMRRVTALVLCSRYEGLGNVIVEALACGTPVIATDCPHGPSEVLSGGKFGRLVPVGDAPALAQALFMQIQAGVSDVAALTSRAAAFSAASCADAHEALFSSLQQRPVRVLGLTISPLDAHQIVSTMLVKARPASRSVNLIVTLNIDHVRLLLGCNTDFPAAYRSAHIVCPDGFPVLLYAKLKGLKSNHRVTGCELFHLLANHPRLATQRLCLVLESEATASATLAWARQRGLADDCIHAIVAPTGLSNDEQARKALAGAISSISPTILVMTLGAPVSEVFVHQYQDRLPPCWVICVGQAVRVEIGLTRRAPVGWRRLGCEWLWRLRQEPRRLATRYIKSAVWFPVAIVHDCLSSGAARLETLP